MSYDLYELKKQIEIFGYAVVSHDILIMFSN